MSGGGARGAYEAGVLLALQDAGVPTHILTSSSIGAINAASYAGHGRGYVGNAEPLVQGWLQLTPATVGIDWSRYIIVVAGLIAATAGFGNAFADLLHRFGIFIRQDTPLFTWLLLGVAGTTVLYSYTEFSYLFYVLLRAFRRQRWTANKRKVTSSLIANLVVLGFAVWLMMSTHIEFRAVRVFRFSVDTYLWTTAGAVAVLMVWWLFRDRISRLSQKILKSPLDSGLFQNYDRTRFLKERIHQRRLRRSPIRVVMTAAELYTGREKYFVNKRLEELQNDPGADVTFIHSHFEYAHDLMRAVVASSAFP
ncbi:MAG TPA: patatin-like phospholipase family protein, partial [Terriglobales bacterium]|nr:patatin-like phospholipase family protein [Terriglobales bacterium]